MKSGFAKILVPASLATALVAVAQTASPAAAPQASAAAQPSTSVTTTPARIRIGVVQPIIGWGQGQANASEVLRTLIAEHLARPNIEVVPVTSALPAEAEAECKQKNCNYVLYTSFNQKKSSGAMAFFRSAQSMSNMVPMFGLGGNASTVIGQTVARTALNAAGQLASGVKAKSDVDLEYKLQVPGQLSPLVSKHEDIKAQSDGQDVFTLLVDHASSAIVRAVSAN